MKKTPTPFGLEFLVEIKDADQQKVNGGRRRKRGPIITTMHVSLPQPAFPTGDHG